MNKSVAISRGLVKVNAIIWLAFAFIVITGLHPALPNSQVYRWIMAGLSLLSALLLFILFLMLRSRKKIGYFLTIGFLFSIAALTIMDDLGIIDFIVLLITITPVILLIKDRKWYLT